MTEKIRILFLSANPVDTGLFRLGQEARDIGTEIQASQFRDKFELIQQWAPTQRDLQRVLLRYKPHIVHFSGHGSLTDEIVLEDSSGEGKRVSWQAIAALFRVLSDSISIVFFDACLSPSQASAISNVIDYTVGTYNDIGERAALSFAVAFYRALAFEHTVREAFEMAKVELAFSNFSGPGLPEIFVRDGVDDSEPFLRQTAAEQKDHIKKLKLALAKLATGTSEEDERSIVRRSIADGRLVFEQHESTNVETDFSEALEMVGQSEALHLQVSTSTYQRIQEQLYPPPPGLAPPLPGLFVVGRESALNDVKSLLGAGAESLPSENPIVVRGWPGVGKTTLVSLIGRDPEVLEAFPDGVLWATLEQRPELMTKLAGWGRALGTDELLRKPTLNEAVATLNALLRNRRMLLIVDDVWDSAHAFPFLRACAESKSKLLVTTRLTGVAEEIATSEGSIYVLPVLTEDSALLLLHNIAPSIVQRYPDECRELVRDLEYLPIALHVAGRLLKAEAKMGVGVRNLITGLRESRTLIQLAPVDRAEGAVIPTLQALLQRNTDSLDEQTQECFMYLGAFAPKPATFSLAAMSAVWQVQDPKPIVRELVRHGLLEPVSEDRFQMHALLVEHARSLASR